MNTNANDFIIIKNNNGNKNPKKLSQIENVVKLTANKIYDNEVVERATKKILVGITPTQHSKLTKYTTDRKLDGDKEVDNVGKLVRHLIEDFIKDNDL